MISRPGPFCHCFCDGVGDTDDDGGEMLADFWLLCVCVRACVVLCCLALIYVLRDCMLICSRRVDIVCCIHTGVLLHTSIRVRYNTCTLRYILSTIYHYTLLFNCYGIHSFIHFIRKCSLHLYTSRTWLIAHRNTLYTYIKCLHININKLVLSHSLI